MLYLFTWTGTGGASHVDLSFSFSHTLLCFLYSFSFFQDPLSGGHSSGSSTSSLSTPPSAAHSPPQQQVNGVGMAGVAVQPGNANSTLPAIAGATGLMGALQGNHLAIVGALNGVIQTSPNLAQNSSHLPHPSAATSASLPMSNCLSNRYKLALAALDFALRVIFVK